MKLGTFSQTGSDGFSDVLTDAVTYAHLRVGSAPSDSALISQYRNAALETIEARANLQLRRGTMSARMTGFNYAAFPIGPNVSVSSVQYVPGTGGSLETLDASQWSVSEQGNVQRIEFYNTPSTHQFTIEPVKINFSVGYASAADVPAAIVSAALLLVGHFYENRQQNVVGLMPAAIETGVDSLLSPFRVVF